MTHQRLRGFGSWLILVSLLTVGAFAQQYQLDDPVPPGSVRRIVDLVPRVVDLVFRADDLVFRTDVAPAESEETVRNRRASGPHSSMSGDFLYLPANPGTVLTLTIRVANAKGQPLSGKRVQVSRASDESGVTITQPAALTDASGITKARVTPAGPPHAEHFIARVVDDDVEIGQTVELVVQAPEPPSFFAPAFAPYYDGVDFVVEPLPLRVGQATTVRLPLTNRRSVPVELRARIFAGVPNIGLGNWPKVGETDTMVLKPGETREVTVTWVPTVDQEHVCLKVELWGSELTTSATSGLSTTSPRLVYASFIPTLSAAAPDNPPRLLGGRQHNIGPVAALAGCTSSSFDEYVLPGLPLETDFAYYSRVSKLYRAKADELRSRLETLHVQQQGVPGHTPELDAQERAASKEYGAYQYLAWCSADEVAITELQAGRRPQSVHEKAFCADAVLMLQFALDWTAREIAAYESAMTTSIMTGTEWSPETLEFLRNSLRETKELLQVMDRCAKDPPDPNYRTLAAAAADTAAATIAALTVSMERYQGAEAAGDADWMARHFTARRLYLQRYAAQARARADAMQLIAEKYPPGTPEQLAHLRSAAASPSRIAGFRAVLLDTAERYRDSADRAELFAGFGAVGAPGKSARPRSFSYLVANPRSGDETIDLLIRRAFIPRDWKVSIVDAGQAAKRRIEEIEAGVHYRVRLHGGEQIPVSSLLVTIGIIPEHTNVNWAVEGSIAGTLIGGIVHSVYVPGPLPDLRLPPIAAVSPESGPAVVLPGTQTTSRLSWMIAGSSIVIVVIVLLVWRRKRRE